jgi:GntR family transcriptional repressor for pyruvate dehydrogenase complex
MVLKAEKNLSEALAERLRKQIEREQLRDGQLFMTEAEVAEKYGVSRTVAREAVGRLRAIGLLEGRQRKGLIVRYPDPVQLFSSTLTTLAHSAQQLAELSRLRYVLEVGAIELAVRQATTSQIDQLLELAEQFQQVGDGPEVIERERELDLQFHSLLLEMTGSSLIAGMQRVLVDFFHTIVIPKPPDAVALKRIAWEHQELATAVRDRDVERARTMIRIQVRRYLPEQATGT